MPARKPLEKSVKIMVKEMLDSLPGKIWWNMAVPFGYGSSQLDFTICYRGWCIAIETKRNAKLKPTIRQSETIDRIEQAGGLCFLCYDAATVNAAGEALARLPLRDMPYQPIGPSLMARAPHVALR